MADISTVAQIYDNSGNEITAARIGANAYKNENPFTRFGTRSLRFVKVVVSGGTPVDISTTPTITNSNLSKLVRAAQNYGELAVVGTPSSTGVILAFSDDTLNDGSAASPSVSDASYAKMEAEILAALGSWGSGVVTVTTVVPTGITFA
jgi:hypothetical protein